MAIVCSCVDGTDGIFLKFYVRFSNRCNRLKCPLGRLSSLQCYNMGHNGHGINLHGLIMTLMGNEHAVGKSSLGHLSLVHRHHIWCSGSPNERSNPICRTFLIGLFTTSMVTMKPQVPTIRIAGTH